VINITAKWFTSQQLHSVLSVITRTAEQTRNDDVDDAGRLWRSRTTA